MSNEEQQYNELIDWAGGRIDYLLSRSKACKTHLNKRKNRLNAQALEEEYFDWFAARHSDSKSNVLFIPYYKSVGNDNWNPYKDK
jgi:hypothetical protein